MLVAGFFFAAMGVFVKFGAESFDAAELAFYRSFLGLLFIAGLALTRKWPLRTPHLGGHVIRSVVGTVSLIGYFYAMSKLPLATAQTLNYTSPILPSVLTLRYAQAENTPEKRPINAGASVPRSIVGWSSSATPLKPTAIATTSHHENFSPSTTTSATARKMGDV